MSVIDWLMEADPSIRWQVMADLMDASAVDVAAERARVAHEGWGAELLARQTANGLWGGDAAIPAWTSSPEWHAMMSLAWLRDLGLDPSSSEARRAVALTAENVPWHWWDNRPFFWGEVEPCINGRVLAVASYFGQPSGDLVDRLLADQMADGGWNCEQENGATVGSFHSTINVLEGLLEHELANDGRADVHEARLRGDQYLLERGLLRRRSTSEIVDPEFTRLSFPTSYHYDVLRGLEYLRVAGYSPDERMSEAIDVVEGKRGEDGRWLLEKRHDDLLELDVGEAEGQPSRWITLRALRTLRWAQPSTA